MNSLSLSKSVWLVVFAVGGLGVSSAQDDRPRVRKGTLDVLRNHDTIELYLEGRRLVTDDPLPLAALHGRQVELSLRPVPGRNTNSLAPERRGARLAQVVQAINPRPWSGAGMVRRAGEGLKLVNEQGAYDLVVPHASLTSRLADQYIDCDGWVYSDSPALVLSSAVARIVVAVDKNGKPTEGAYLNERTVDANGVATYAQRFDLEPGRQVRVFDLVPYRRAKRNAAGEITKPGVWRASLNDMVGGDILLARVTLERAEKSPVSGWIPVRKLAIGGPPPPSKPGVTKLITGQSATGN